MGLAQLQSYLCICRSTSLLPLFFVQLLFELFKTKAQNRFYFLSKTPQQYDEQAVVQVRKGSFFVVYFKLKLFLYSNFLSEFSRALALAHLSVWKHMRPFHHQMKIMKEIQTHSEASIDV